MKKISGLFLILLLGLAGLYAETYESTDFFYSLEIPYTWYVADDEDPSQVILANAKDDAAFLIGVFANEDRLTATDFLQSFIKRMRLNGKPEEVVFKGFKGSGGIFTFTMNDMLLKAQVVIFNTKTCFFMLMASSLNDTYAQNSKDFKTLFNSFNLDAKTLDAAYGYSEKADTTTPVATTTDKRGSYYSIQIDWKDDRSEFVFVEEDFYKAVEEGKKILASGDLLKYYNIKPKEDPYYSMTFWRCFYQDMYNKNYLRVRAMVEWFKNKAAEKRWTAYQLAANVVKCIQNIPYERPYNVVSDKTRVAAVLDYFTPNELAWYKKGDCDTKSMLIIMILHQLGYEAVLLFSEYYEHAMVGINLNATGAYKTVNGKKFYFVETTYPGWNIGDLPPDFNDVSKWQVLVIQ